MPAMFPLSPSMCRVCAIEGDDNESLFELTGGHSPANGGISEAGHIFTACMSIELLPDDGFPQAICFRCNTQLRMFYEFKRGALRMHQKFTDSLLKLRQTIVKSEVIADSPAAAEPVAEATDLTPLPSSADDVSNDSYPVDEGVEMKPTDADLSGGVLAEEEEDEVVQELDDVRTEEDCSQDDNSSASAPGDSQTDPDESKALEADVDDDDKMPADLEDNAESVVEVQSDDDDDDNGGGEGGLDEGEMDVMYLDEEILDDGEEQSDFVEDFDLAAFSVEPAGEIAAGEADQQQQPLGSRAKRRRRMPATDAGCEGEEDTGGMPCKKCGKLFKRMANLQKHVCQRPDESMYRCDHCSAQFPTKQRRDMHAARHTDDRPVPCDRCDKSFKNKYDLKVHQRAHDDMRQHVCPICGNAFRAHTHLKNHLDSHATNNNYPCKYCDQKYKTQITLTRHIVSMHTNKDEFFCAECGKSFGLKFRFERHLKIHQRKRAFEEKGSDTEIEFMIV